LSCTEAFSSNLEQWSKKGGTDELHEANGLRHSTNDRRSCHGGLCGQQKGLYGKGGGKPKSFQ
jgi:hypothetical protein